MDKEACLRFPAELDQLAEIRRFVEESAIALQANPEPIASVVHAVDEAASNIIVHGYQGRPGMIEVEVKPEGSSLVVLLRDNAPLFDPTRLPDPDLSLPLEERPLGGMGFFLIRQFMDEIRHRVTPQGGNELTLVKKAILPDYPKGGIQ